MKMCLLFCASAGDLKLCDIDDDGSPATSPSAATHSGGNNEKPVGGLFLHVHARTSEIRRTSIACEKEVLELHTDPFNHPSVSRRKARAIRRKNFLDICKEAVQQGVI